MNKIQKLLTKARQLICSHGPVVLTNPYVITEPDNLYLVKGVCETCGKKLRFFMIYEEEPEPPQEVLDMIAEGGGVF